MNMKKINHITVAVFLLMQVFTTCKNPESLYEEYIVPNGTYYPGKAMNAEAHSGNMRIEIAWQNGTDPKVTKARIFWNNYSDSVEVAVRAGDAIARKIIEQLNEDTYSFMIHTYDTDGNVSVPVEVMGTVYGEWYMSTLKNRLLKSAEYHSADESLKLVWDAVNDETEMVIELEYTDTHNAKQRMTVKSEETTVLLNKFKLSEPLVYKTRYKPTSTAIDWFYAPTEEKQIEYSMVEKPIDNRSVWSAVYLSNDIPEANHAWPLSNLWDNVMQEWNGINIATVPVPASFTIDMKEPVSLTRFKIWQMKPWQYIENNIKKFELYGNMDPNPNWKDGWNPLGKFDLVPPSGKTPPTDEDIAYANQGIDCNIAVTEFAPDPYRPFRYLRFKLLENYHEPAPSLPFNWDELKIWGNVGVTTIKP